MGSLRGALGTLVATGVLWWLHLWHFLPRMPERIATHFDLAGSPDGWMSRSTLAAFDLVFLVMVVSVVIGAGFLVRVLPTELINVPHRDYWFAPERREQSLRRMLVHMTWLASLVVGFLIGVNHLIFMANLAAGPVRLPGLGTAALLGAFLAAIVVWIVRLYRMFPRPR